MYMTPLRRCTHAEICGAGRVAANATAADKPASGTTASDAGTTIRLLAHDTTPLIAATSS